MPTRPCRGRKASSRGDTCFLGFNDIIEPQPGMTPPAVEHVIRLIRFARDWDRSAPLLIHCFAGISRSTAAAYATAMALEPEQERGSASARTQAPRAVGDPEQPARGHRRRHPRPQGAHGRCDRGDRAGRGRFRGHPLRPAAEGLTRMGGAKTAIEIGLSAAIVSVADNEPLILSTPGPDGRSGLPFGPFDPLAHRTIETGLRAWVAEQTRLSLGYVEQLYTFGDRGRHKTAGDAGTHVVSVGYLALRARHAARTAARERRRNLAAVVRVPPLGGLARRQAGASRRGDPSGAVGLGEREARPTSGRCASPRAARGLLLAFGVDGPSLGRGTRARALRASLRGGPRRGDLHRRAGGAAPRLQRAGSASL